MLQIIGNVGDYIRIKAPITYKPQLATTSTEDSDRTQDLVMHNTPMGTILGSDMTWGDLKTEEVRMILDLMVNKSSFSMPGLSKSKYTSFRKCPKCLWFTFTYFH